MKRVLTETELEKFKGYLIKEEKSLRTVEKYLRDVGRFITFANGREIEKSTVIAYKTMLERSYAVSSANTMLAALNGFFRFMEWQDLTVKQFKFQNRSFCPHLLFNGQGYSQACRHFGAYQHKYHANIHRYHCRRIQKEDGGDDADNIKTAHSLKTAGSKLKILGRLIPIVAVATLVFTLSRRKGNGDNVLNSKKLKFDFRCSIFFHYIYLLSPNYAFIASLTLTERRPP